MIAARITRRIVRKITKPMALWWTNRQLAQAEERANYFMDMRNQVVPFELHERRRTVELTAKLRQIENW
ncbi:MAG: hypothetical protein ACXU89_09395 [Xanthobacteraceae bacterium]